VLPTPIVHYVVLVRTIVCEALQCLSGFLPFAAGHAWRSHLLVTLPSRLALAALALQLVSHPFAAQCAWLLLLVLVPALMVEYSNGTAMAFLHFQVGVVQ
jgi:hypothetical protein